MTFNVAGYMARLIVIIALVAALYLASAASLGSGKPSRKTAAMVTRLVWKPRRRNEERSESQIYRRDNQSHVKSAASPNNVNVHRRRREEEQLLQSPQQSHLYYLTLFIQFDDYAYDLGWTLHDELHRNVDSKLRGYGGRQRGENVTEIIPLDNYLTHDEGYFRRYSEEEQGTTFFFTMSDYNGDGLRRGGYYQLDFTNAVVRETTELTRASRFGHRSLVVFRLVVPSLQKQQNGAGTFVRVLDSWPSTVEEPTASPMAPPTPLLGTSFLRFKLDYPGKIFSWQLSLLDPQTLSAVSLVQEGQYSGRKDGELHSLLPLGKTDSFYEFALTEETYSGGPLNPAFYELTFVSATHRDEIRMFLCRKRGKSRASTDAISFAVFASGSKVYPATRGPTVEPTHSPTHPPTMEPTIVPSVSPAPSSERTMEPTLLQTVSPAPTSEPSSPTVPPTPIPTYYSTRLSQAYEDSFLLLLIVSIPCSIIALCVLAKLLRSNGNDHEQLLQPRASDIYDFSQVERGDSIATQAGLLGDERLRHIRKNLLSVPITSAKDGTGMPQCSICLVEYEDGDFVCFSGDSRCEHKFHRDCMTAWLQHHEECPCCRRPYLPNENRPEV